MSQNICIIPEPVLSQVKEGHFYMDNKIQILHTDDCEKLAKNFGEYLLSYCNLKVTINRLEHEFKDIKSITLQLNQNLSVLYDEGYFLKINDREIIINSRTLRGIFYGIQTLKQIISKNLEIPCLEIEDYPRFSWRGFMLDEARHFFGIDEIKKILDLMALLKYNIFHWHLTDDQGWRIEIKHYPLLKEISSRREGTYTGERKLMSDLQKDKSNSDNVPISGFYTQEQIKEIIQYADDRFITIIPEIDFPGHVQAVLAAFPELSCSGGPFNVSQNFGVHKDVFCIGKEVVYEFSKNVLIEVMNLFPTKLIHVGGDEVPVRRFKKCVDCQKLIEREGLENEKQLQPYFTSQISKFIEENDHRLIGWNEILNNNLSKSAICQFWAGDFSTTIEHVKKGRDTIMSDMRFVYLNYPYKLTPIEQSYEYDPIPDDLPTEYHKHILGIEACLWTEYVKNAEILEYQVFPRLIAIAETGWTLKRNKNLDSFMERLNLILKILDDFEINYAKDEDYEVQF
ncbi:MAG: beta-N-acetylhexosaminidase [Promethearchaeota archaeon]